MARGDKIRLTGRRAYQSSRGQDAFPYYRNKLVLQYHDYYAILVCLLTDNNSYKVLQRPVPKLQKGTRCHASPRQPNASFYCHWERLARKYNWLGSDMRLCLLGSPDVKVVLILNWTKLPYGRVKGTVGAFSRDIYGQPYRRQHAVCTFYPISCCIFIIYNWLWY